MASKPTVEIPGAVAGQEPPADPSLIPSDSDTPEVAALKAELAQANAKLAEATKLPQVVYEPTTPKGAEAIAAAKETIGMTTAEVMAKIDAGQMREPFTSVLCKDGYYVRRS